MKKLYVVMIFLVFFNIFTFMFAGFENMFPYAYEGDNANYDISETGTANSSEILFNVSGGFTFDNALRLFFADLSDTANVILSFVLLGVAAVAAWLTKSPAPFVVGFIGNLMKNIYMNSVTIFEKLPLNNYLMLAGLFGMVILFLVTCAETLTHGEA